MNERLRGTTKSGNKWKAQIRVGDKVVNLGYYDTTEEAHTVHKIAYLKVYGIIFEEKPTTEQKIDKMVRTRDLITK